MKHKCLIQLELELISRTDFKHYLQNNPNQVLFSLQNSAVVLQFRYHEALHIHQSNHSMLHHLEPPFPTTIRKPQMRIQVICISKSNNVVDHNIPRDHISPRQFIKQF
ncbi:hypothetical protein AAHE18_02G083700 [Arachis hypogaea]